MGKRVPAALGAVAPLDGVLTSGLSAAPIPAEAATPSTAERTASEEARSWALYRQAGAEGAHVDRHAAHPHTCCCPGRAGARHRARADITPPAGRSGVWPPTSTRSTSYTSPRGDFPTLTFHPRKHA
ncbi:hypothetical protein ACKI1J_13110 [Streptomyces scabiei]|uniref:hypothetical protein n=1 Tax=Streptomyces scabiei TaxID=1930 RepID=UPI0038F65DEE